MKPSRFAAPIQQGQAVDLSGNLTFLDQAKDWIVAKRRDAIAQV